MGADGGSGRGGANGGDRRLTLALERLRRLRYIARALSGALTPEQVADVIRHDVAPELGGVARALWFVDEPRAVLRLVDPRDDPRVAAFETLALDGRLPASIAARTGQPIFVDGHAERARDWPMLAQLPSDQSFAVVPLVAGDQVLGVFSTGYDADHAFDADERDFLMAVGDLAGLAVERGRLHVSATRAAERLALLAEASAVLASSLDFGETLATVARLMVPRVADLAAVHLFDEEGILRRVSVAHRDPDAEAFILAHESLHTVEAPAAGLGNVAFGTEPLLVVDAAPTVAVRIAVDDEHAHMLDHLAISSTVVAPLVAREGTLGVVSFVRVGDSPPYGDADAALAKDLAVRAAVAIENARLHAQRTEIAQALQASLLPPQLPETDVFDVAAAYRPAGEGMDVGGDFYDVFAGSDGAWNVMIGDVCGTGPAAAALTGQVRHTARAVAAMSVSPAGIVAAINDALVGTLTEGRFVTLVLARAKRRCRSVELDVVVGGHPPPIVIRSGGESEVLSAVDPLVGAFGEVGYTVQPVRLGQGDTLLLYTDGVVEGRAAPDADGHRAFFGDDRWVKLLCSMAGRPVGEIVAGAEEAVLGFSGGRLGDDVAILALQPRRG